MEPIKRNQYWWHFLRAMQNRVKSHVSIFVILCHRCRQCCCSGSCCSCLSIVKLFVCIAVNLLLLHIYTESSNEKNTMFTTQSVLMHSRKEYETKNELSNTRKKLVPFSCNLWSIFGDHWKYAWACKQYALFATLSTQQIFVVRGICWFSFFPIPST